MLRPTEPRCHLHRSIRDVCFGLEGTDGRKSEPKERDRSRTDEPHDFTTGAFKQKTSYLELIRMSGKGILIRLEMTVIIAWKLVAVQHVGNHFLGLAIHFRAPARMWHTRIITDDPEKAPEHRQGRASAIIAKGSVHRR